MKKIIALALLAVAVVAAAGIRYAANDEPEYIRSAEIRVGSYLTSDYGGVACSSKKINDRRWELDCTHQARGKTFQVPNSGFPAPSRTGTVVITISATSPSRRNDWITFPPSR